MTTGFRALAQFHAGNMNEAREEMDKAIAIMRQIQSPAWIGNDVLILIGSMIRYWPKPTPREESATQLEPAPK